MEYHLERLAKELADGATLDLDVREAMDLLGAIANAFAAGNVLVFQTATPLNPAERHVAQAFARLMGGDQEIALQVTLQGRLTLRFVEKIREHGAGATAAAFDPMPDEASAEEYFHPLRAGDDEPY
jgi:hypothetical protein